MQQRKRAKVRFGTLRIAAIAVATASAAGMAWQSAGATEGGASLYVLGSGVPGSAIMPPLEGVFFDDMLYVYNGEASADRQFVVGGNLVAGLDLTLVFDGFTVLWVPTKDFLGGTLAVGGLFAVAAPFVTVSAVLTGPRGRQVTVTRRDSDILIADPVLVAALGWQNGNLHYQLSGTLNVPVGQYKEGELANVAFHRWIFDTSFATTWHDDKSGWDVSGKLGFTFNGTNDFTDYNTGNEFHLEGGVEKTLSPKFSLGALGFYYKQISGDSGAGATLGPNKGEVWGLGATAAFNFKMARVPASLRLRAVKEFDATRRPEGYAVFLSLDVPISLKLPKAAPQ